MLISNIKLAYQMFIILHTCTLIKQTAAATVLCAKKIECSHCRNSVFDSKRQHGLTEHFKYPADVTSHIHIKSQSVWVEIT